ncbi:uncharacterized protein LOC128952115 [Oppia nitens]|uniref:uncharacterized protein LOC128952115 n=1 Tax=Oppia nitens TaxID=1686743 RepID=UPI0023DC8CBA|nr:uncharacterized protein LOC128952115 [Oppia nitens]
MLFTYMFSYRFMVAVIVITHMILTVVIADKPAKKKSDDGPPKSDPKPFKPKPYKGKLKALSPQQVEFAKAFYANLMKDQSKKFAEMDVDSGKKGAKKVAKKDEDEDKMLKASADDADDEEEEKGEEKEDSEDKSKSKKSKSKSKSKPKPKSKSKKSKSKSKPKSRSNEEEEEPTEAQESGGGGGGNGPDHMGTLPPKASGMKMAASGGMQFFDQIIHYYVPMGDPYGGMPDGLLSMGKWCVEFWIKGALGIMYTTVRYPHKIMLKMLIAISALTWIPMNFIYCANPFSMANFIAKSKIINRSHDKLAKIHKEWKIRLANLLDKVIKKEDMFKVACCGFAEWKRKSIEAIADEGKEFAARWFASFFKMHQLVYCSDYQDGSDLCQGIEYIDDEPIRVLPRSWITLFLEKCTKFF